MRGRSMMGAALAGVVATGTVMALQTRAGADAPPAAVTPLARERAYRAAYEGSLSALDSALVRLDTAVAGLAEPGRPATPPGSAAAGAAVRDAFRRARGAYKRVEVLAEYYAPVTAAAMNGPALDQPDEDAPTKVVAPSGLQVIEGALFPVVRRGEAIAMRREVRTLRVNVRRLREIAEYTHFGDAQVLDAARLEVARVVTLGLAGFDASASGDGLGEAAAALRGVWCSLAPLEERARERDAAAWTSLETALARALTVLDTAPDFDRFDRLGFIAAYANSVAAAIGRVRTSLGVPPVAARRGWRPEANTVFDSGAWDASAYAPLDAPATTPALVALGEALFFEPALSGDGTRSCASCHDPSRAFTDGRPRAALAGAHRGAVARNTPTIINAGLQAGAFADERVAYLEDQVTDVIGNPGEMGGDVSAAAARLGCDSVYRRRFAAVFGGREGAGRSTPAGVAGIVGSAKVVGAATPERLRAALAAYMRSLTRLEARFDRAVRGDTAAVTTQERLGFTVFMGKGKCGTCHFAPLFNGTVPPEYAETEVEVIGAPARAVTRGAVLDVDPGRARVTRAPLHRGAFKTPSLRNVALTAPYMHNGAYPTLESVVDFYNRGGGVGVGARVSNQTLPAEPLRLTKEERGALVAFLHTLTDTAGTTRRPAR